MQMKYIDYICLYGLIAFRLLLKTQCNERVRDWTNCRACVAVCVDYQLNDGRTIKIAER
jgi:hypothetical protein